MDCQPVLDKDIHPLLNQLNFHLHQQCKHRNQHIDSIVVFQAMLVSNLPTIIRPKNFFSLDAKTPFFLNLLPQIVNPLLAIPHFQMHQLETIFSMNPFHLLNLTIPEHLPINQDHLTSHHLLLTAP